MNFRMKFLEMVIGNMKKLFLFFCFVLVFPCSIAQNIPKKPSPARFVNDYAKVLSQEDKQNLEEKLFNYQDTSNIQVVIVTVESLLGRDIKDLSNDWASQWQIGQKGSDNGLLILVAMKEKQIRFEVGYGLESFLTDSECLEIIKKDMFPSFKNKAYILAFNLALKAIFKELQSAEFESSPLEDTSESSSWWIYLLPIIPIFLLIGYLMNMYNKRRKL